MSSDRRREEHDDRLVGLHDRPDDVDGTGTDLLDPSGVHLVEPDSKLSLAKPIVNELLGQGDPHVDRALNHHRVDQARHPGRRGHRSGSAQQRAAHRLVQLPRVPVIALTGSLMGGYASSLFANAWALSQRFRQPAAAATSSI